MRWELYMPNPSRWRHLAEQAHLAGDGMTALETKTLMLEIAAAYLRLKDRANGQPVRLHSLNEKPPTIIPDKDTEA